MREPKWPQVPRPFMLASATAPNRPRFHRQHGTKTAAQTKGGSSIGSAASGKGSCSLRMAPAGWSAVPIAGFCKGWVVPN